MTLTSKIFLNTVNLKPNSHLDSKVLTIKPSTISYLQSKESKTNLILNVVSVKTPSQTLTHFLAVTLSVVSVYKRLTKRWQSVPNAELRFQLKCRSDSLNGLITT